MDEGEDVSKSRVNSTGSEEGGEDRREITLGPTRAIMVSELGAGMRHSSSGNDCLGRS